MKGGKRMETKATEQVENKKGETNGKLYGDAPAQPIVAQGKTQQELNLEMAHAELLATARMCEKMTEPKTVKGVTVERHLTRHNLEAMGSSAIDALSAYYTAHKAFELSER